MSVANEKIEKFLTEGLKSSDYEHIVIFYNKENGNSSLHHSGGLNTVEAVGVLTIGRGAVIDQYDDKKLPETRHA